MTKKELLNILQGIEFGFATRYGYACPVCHGAKTDCDGIHERGPDGGHNEGCKLRKALLEGVGGSTPPICTHCYQNPAEFITGAIGKKVVILCGECNVERSKWV